MKLMHAIPALPASDMERSAAFYRDKLGFTVLFQDDGFTKLLRDRVEVHLWLANDESWRGRDGGAHAAYRSPASNSAGSALCHDSVSCSRCGFWTAHRTCDLKRE